MPANLKIALVTAAFLLSAPTAQAQWFAFQDTAGATTYTDRPSILPRAKATRSGGGIALPRYVTSNQSVTLSASELSGTWRASSEDGMHTRLEVRSSGAFVFDQRDTRSPERTWMCGNLEFSGDTMAMDLSTVKHRDADGIIEQQLTDSQSEATVVSSAANRMVLRFEGQTLVFQRVADASG